MSKLGPHFLWQLPEPQTRFVIADKMGEFCLEKYVNVPHFIWRNPRSFFLKEYDGLEKQEFEAKIVIRKKVLKA